MLSPRGAAGCRLAGGLQAAAGGAKSAPGASPPPRGVHLGESTCGETEARGGPTLSEGTAPILTSGCSCAGPGGSPPTWCSPRCRSPAGGFGDGARRGGAAAGGGGGSGGGPGTGCAGRGGGSAAPHLWLSWEKWWGWGGTVLVRVPNGVPVVRVPHGVGCPHPHPITCCPCTEGLGPAPRHSPPGWARPGGTALARGPPAAGGSPG